MYFPRFRLLRGAIMMVATVHDNSATLSLLTSGVGFLDFLFVDFRSIFGKKKNRFLSWTTGYKPYNYPILQGETFLVGNWLTHLWLWRGSFAFISSLQNNTL
jgi:hypothetical protein